LFSLSVFINASWSLSITDNSCALFNRSFSLPRLTESNIGT